MEALRGLTTSVTQLGSRLDKVCSQLSQVDPSPPHPAPQPAQVEVPSSSREPFILIPARYSGELGQCGQFSHQCSTVFDQQSSTYATDKARVAFVMSLLESWVSHWVVAASGMQSPFCSSFTLFTAKLLKIFDQPVQGKEVSNTNSVADFAVSLAAETGWDKAALQGVFS